MKTKAAPASPATKRARGKPFAAGNTAGVAFRFPKGVSGNPSGRVKYAVVAEAARALLAMPIPDDPEGRLVAEGIIDRLGSMALDGDLAAAQLLFDRAEGRAKQGIDFNDGSGDVLDELLQEFRIEHERGYVPPKTEEPLQ